MGALESFDSFWRVGCLPVAVSFMRWTLAFLKTADVETDFGFLSAALWDVCLFAMMDQQMAMLNLRAHRILKRGFLILGYFN